MRTPIQTLMHDLRSVGIERTPAEVEAALSKVTAAIIITIDTDEPTPCKDADSWRRAL